MINKICRLTFVVLYLGSGLFRTNLAYAESGNEGARGGDWVASEFTAKAQQVFSMLKVIPANSALLTSDQNANLKAAIERTPVASVIHPLYDSSGLEKDALTLEDPSSPTGRSIQLNRHRWETILTSDATVHRLVFHEYLWASSIDDTNYRISGRLVTSLHNSDLQRRDALAGTQWLATLGSTELGVKVYISFAHDGTFVYQHLLSSADSFGVSRGRQSSGTYTLEAGQILLNVTKRTCPIQNAELGLDSNLSVEAKFNGHNIVFSESTQPSSIVLSPYIGTTPVSSATVWGCLSKHLTFTPFADGFKSGDSIPVIPSLSNQNGDRFQVVAYSPFSDAHGKSWGWSTLAEAAMQAVRACGKVDCYLLSWSRNQCIALVTSDRRGIWAATDKNLLTAEYTALGMCKTASPTSRCEVSQRICPI